jgi:hypothetical protein
MATTPTLLSVNDTSGSLGNGAVFNGNARQMHVGYANAPGVPVGRYASSVVVTANPANAATIIVQGSQDYAGSAGWVTVDTLVAPGGSAVSKEVAVPFRFVRIQVQNGSTTQVVSVTTAFQA